MPIIDTLSVALVARTSKWSKGLKSARNDLSKFATGVASSAARAGALTAGLLGAGVVAGMTALVKNQFDAIDSTVKLARRLDASTESLTAYRFAAGQSGISTESFDAAMQKLVKNAAEAATGLGESRLAFKDLGIDAAAFTKLPLDEKIGILAERFSEMSDAGRAALDATQLFGRGGQPLLAMLKEGRGGLDVLVAQAKQLGLTFSEVDATKIEEANDAFARMQQLSVGVANSIAIALAPYVEGLSDRFTEAATAGGNLGDTIVNSMERAAVAVTKVANLFSLLQATWYGFQGAVQQVGSWAVSVFQKMGAGVDWVMSKIPGLKPSAENQKKFAAEQGAMKEIASRLAEEAAKSFNKAGSKLVDFSTGSDGAGIRQFFAEVRAKAEQATAAVRAAPSGLLPDATTGGKLKLDQFAAKALNIKDVFIGALATQSSKKQTVHDPQLLETNELLRAIKRNLTGPVAL